MNGYRKAKGLEASTVVETDGIVNHQVVDKIRKIENVTNVEEILPPMKGE